MAPTLRNQRGRFDGTDDEEDEGYNENEERNGVGEAVGTPDSQNNHYRRALNRSRRKRQKRTSTPPSSLERLPEGNRGINIEQGANDNDEIENTNTGSGQRRSQAGVSNAGVPLRTGELNYNTQATGGNATSGRTSEVPSSTGMNTRLLPLAVSRRHHNDINTERSVGGTNMSDDDEESVSDIEGMIPMSTSFGDASRRALSYRVAATRRQKHVADRIQAFIKATVFRKLKFVTNEAIFNKAMTCVMEREKPADEVAFVRLYKTCIVGAVNTKRSTCEQAGAKIMRELLVSKKHDINNMDPPYSIGVLSLLRRSQSAQEVEAYLWFAGSFLECVSGKRAWGRRKYHERVSDAKDKGTNELLVTVSDEAFALLLYENYISKWMTKYIEERTQIFQTENKRMNGKFTKSSTGNCEYGGWDEDGVRRFNQLCVLVQNDRRCRKAQEMEDYVLMELRKTKLTLQQVEDDVEDDVHNRRHSTVVNAFCEL
jgi:hypothetical protein